jgi:hypothetical protein
MADKTTTNEERAEDRIELQMATLSGDIRDELIREFKTINGVWGKTEDEQERLINRASDIADLLVDRAVSVISSRGLTFFTVKLGDVKATGKGAIDCAFSMPLHRNEHLIGGLCKRINQPVILIARDVDEFLGERHEAKADVVGDLGMPRATHGEHVNPETGEVTAVQQAA